jgi:hypothetical protein
MKHLLRVGQVFICPKFRGLRYAYKSTEDAPPVVDKTRMHFDHSNKIQVHWIEKGPDNWERKHKDVLDLSIDDPDTIGDQEFLVLETRMAGGGHGHGPHDIYPDGWWVIARELGARKRLVRFAQSGCFVGLCPPEDVFLKNAFQVPDVDATDDEKEDPPSVWVTG